MDAEELPAVIWRGCRTRSLNRIGNEECEGYPDDIYAGRINPRFSDPQVPKDGHW